jgi:hypothetical protein
MSGHETCVDWWTRAVIGVIHKGTLYAKYAHGGHEGQKMRPVWVKKGLYWCIGEYMIRLDRLNKYSLFKAHGRRDVRTPVTAWGAPLGLISLCSVVFLEGCNGFVNHFGTGTTDDSIIHIQ